MAESNKKFNIVSIIVLAVLGVALVMGIVGLCINWMTVSYESFSDSMKLKELIDLNKEAKEVGVDGYKGIEAAQAFGIIAVIAAALTAVSYVVSKFVDIKALKFVTIGLAVVLIVCALLALILTFTSTTGEEFKAAKDLGYKYMPAAGAWLLSIFGIVGGAAGIVGAIKG